jgi:hypothetical protein
VSETKVELLEGEEEEDRIWEAMNPETEEDSIQSIHLDSEDEKELLKMWNECARVYERDFFGREISYRETNEKIYCEEVLV